jgi:hypothetical protein
MLLLSKFQIDNNALCMVRERCDGEHPVPFLSRMKEISEVKKCKGEAKWLQRAGPLRHHVPASLRLTTTRSVHCSSTAMVRFMPLSWLSNI